MLVNGDSASAAEIVSGAIKDTGHGTSWSAKRPSARAWCRPSCACRTAPPWRSRPSTTTRPTRTTSTTRASCRTSVVKFTDDETAQGCTRSSATTRTRYYDLQVRPAAAARPERLTQQLQVASAGRAPGRVDRPLSPALSIRERGAFCPTAEAPCHVNPAARHRSPAPALAASETPTARQLRLFKSLAAAAAGRAGRRRGGFLYVRHLGQPVTILLDGKPITTVRNAADGQRAADRRPSRPRSAAAYPGGQHRPAAESPVAARRRRHAARPRRRRQGQADAGAEAARPRLRHPRQRPAQPRPADATTSPPRRCTWSRTTSRRCPRTPT